MTAPRYSNGYWRITVTDPDQFQLKNFFPPSNQLTPPVVTGTAQKLTYVTAPVTEWNPLYASSRKTGRPFGLLIGRRKKRR